MAEKRTMAQTEDPVCGTTVDPDTAVATPGASRARSDRHVVH